MSSVLPAHAARKKPSDVARLFATAQQLHRGGRLAEARRVYRQVLELDPRHADATHMLGLLTAQAGQPEAAIGLIRAAIAVNGSVAAYHFNLGVTLLNLGRFGEAVEAWRAVVRLQPSSAKAHFNLGAALQGAGESEAAVAVYQTALRLQPDYPDVQFNLGNALVELGRLDEAIRAFRAAIRLRPDYAKAFSNLGATLGKARHFEEAVAACREAVRLEPDYAAAYTNLGTALHNIGQLDEAVAACREAVRLKPDYAEAYSNLGTVLQKLGRGEEAVAACREAMRLRAGFVEAHANLGAALERLGRFEEAEAVCREALRLKPDCAEAYANLGAVQGKTGCFEGAVSACREAVRLAPDHAEAHTNLGTALGQSGHLAEAEAACREAVRLEPDYAETHFNLGMLLLAQGEMEQGWQEYEWRWRTRQLAASRQDFSCPQWHGEPGEGRTLLIHAEQGFGDTLQFCRYAPLAAARGWRVLLLVPRPLARLLGSLASAEIVAEGEALPPCDRHCPMLSLPLALGTRVETIPGATPYLAADPGEVASWRARLDALCGPGLRVGLAWAGNPRRHSPAAAAVDRRRSVAPELLAPLLQVPGVHFVSLQKDGPAAPAEFGLIEMMGEMGDFADTAALVAGLDLVVSVDTSMVHLAGALGRPVWMLDRFDHCWRWLGDRRDSPWYPGLRLYRQSRPGDWEEPIAEIARDLAAQSK